MAAPLRVGILGGGITGLSTAFYLRKALGSAVQVVLLEGSPRVGGWIESKVHEEEGHPCDGFMFECGPRSFRPQKNGIHILQLAEELGIHTDAVLAPKGLPRLIYTDGKIHPLPSSLVDAVRSPLIQKAIPSVLKEPFAKNREAQRWTTTDGNVTSRARRAVDDDESIHAFVSRRFSPYVAEQFLDPMVSGIFAGDIKSLSVKSVFRILWDMEENHGSVVRGMFFGKGYENPPGIAPPSKFVKDAQASMSVSFRHGLQQLPDALVSHLTQNGVELQTDWPVGNIELPGEGEPDSVHVQCASDPSKTETFDVVFSTLSAQALAQTLSSSCAEADAGTASVSKGATTCMHLEQTRKTLGTIRSSSVASISLGYNAGVLPYDGFGYLIPSFEKLKALGVIFDSHVFPAQNKRPWHTRLTVMAGGVHHPELIGMPRDELVELAQSTVKKHLKIKQDADIAIVNAHHDCIPQYDVGHSQRLKDILHSLQRHVEGKGGQVGPLAEPTVEGMSAVAASSKLFILGNSFWGVGVSDCVATSQEAATLFAAQLQPGGVIQEHREMAELRRQNSELEAKLTAIGARLAAVEAKLK